MNPSHNRIGDPTIDIPLAWDANGERFEIPDKGECWLVKRSGRRGPGEVVLDARTGVPLRLPLAATITDLADALCGARAPVPTGRYRLELLDKAGKTVRGVPGAVVLVRDLAASAAPLAFHLENALRVVAEAVARHPDGLKQAQALRAEIELVLPRLRESVPLVASTLVLVASAIRAMEEVAL